eukprot:Hpha_TRINITY_DN10402_c0_g2::TRINITY_DN10402_c0_g2_i1::g.193286::m.193286
MLRGSMLSLLWLAVGAASTHLRVVQHDLPEDHAAARELARYVHLLTTTAPLVASSSPREYDELFHIQHADHPGHRITTALDGSRHVVRISGRTSEARLHGCYSLLMQLGVRFAMDGDIIPRGKYTGTTPLPVQPTAGAADFDYRGLQPF